MTTTQNHTITGSMLHPNNKYSWLARLSFAWEHPLCAAAFSMIVYCLFAGWYRPLGQNSIYAYYNYLADAFLHGRLAFRLQPQSVIDLSFYHGYSYPYWPPFPAVLLMPFIAIFGVHFSDIIFTLGVASLNVALIALLLRQATLRGIIQLSRVQRGLLVAFFALGTVALPLAPLGGVWYTGQIVGCLCVILAYLAAISLHGMRAAVLVGLALACALLTRNNLVFAGLWPAGYVLYQARAEGRRRLVGYTVAGFTPVLMAFVVICVYNWLRFDSIWETGYTFHQMNERFRSDFNQYGPFSLHYLSQNFYYQYVAYPFPYDPGESLGGSLFLLSPVFFGALQGLFAGRPRWSAWLLFGSLMLVNIPILLLMGTGWVQFGPRYTFDFTVPLLLLTALGIRRWPIWLLASFTVISIGHYVIGTVILMRP